MSIVFCTLLLSAAAYFAWTIYKIYAIYDHLLREAIDFAYESRDPDVWIPRSNWLRPLIFDPANVVWKPFLAPSAAIHGEFAEEFFAWRRGRRDVAKLIKSAQQEAKL